MEEITMSAEQDKTLVSLLCALTITALSVAFFFVVGVNDMIGEAGRSYQTSSLPMVFIGVFRYACAPTLLSTPSCSG